MAGYTVNITEVRDVVTATSSVNNISITSDNNPNITIDENSFVFTATSVLSTVTIYTDAVELLVDDFANYFRGDWVSGTTYHRGELVNDRYSLFVCSTGTLTTVTSIINPSDYTDTLSWTRVVWNEAPRDHLTVTNYLNVGTNVDIGGTLHVAGQISTDSAMDHLTVTNHLSAGSLSVGSLQGNGLVIDTTATFNGVTTFNNDVFITQGTFTVVDLVVNGTEIVNGALTVNNSATIDRVYTGEIDVAGTGTFHELFTDRLTVADVLFPTDAGLYGQVIANLGDGTADWRNLGDLVFWSLSDDLLTNGFDIITNSDTEGLLIGIGNSATKSDTAFLELSHNGTTRLSNEGVGYSGDLQIQSSGGRLTLSQQNGGSTTTGAILSNDDFAFQVGLGSPWDAAYSNFGFNFNRHSNEWPFVQLNFNDPVQNRIRSRNNMDIRVAGEFEVVAEDVKFLTNNFKIETVTGRIDLGIDIDVTTATVFDPRISVLTTATYLRRVESIHFNDGTTQTTALLSTTATVARLGSVKIGAFIDAAADGTISVNTASLASITLNTATTSLLGGIKIGSSFTASGDGTLGLTTATTSRLGGVKIGAFIDASADGTISVNTASLYNNFTSTNFASKSEFGIVKVGNNIDVAGGTISVPVANNDTFGVIRIAANGGLRNSGDVNSGILEMKPATNYNIGGVIAGNNIAIDNDGVISVAGGGTAGIINLSDVMNTNGYHIQHNYLNTTTFIDLNAGEIEITAPDEVVVKKGDNTRNYSSVRSKPIANFYDEIKIDAVNQSLIGFNWVNTFTSTLTVQSKIISAISPQYDIVARGRKDSGLGINNDLILTADHDVTVRAFNAVNVQATGTVAITANTTTISGNNLNLDVTALSITSANTLTLAAPVVIIGPDEYNSELRVQKIYNRAGTYAPFFPAGIQLADQTVQITAYHPDGGPLPAV